MAKIGLVTVLFNSDNLLDDFFKSLSIQAFSDFHLYLIDNTSNEVTDKLLIELSLKYGLTNFTHVKNPTNAGVAKGNNQGIKLSIEGGMKYTLLLNNDIEFTQPNLLADLFNYCDTNNEMLCIPKIYFFDTKKIWMAGGEFLLYKGLTKHVGEGNNDGTEYNEEKYFNYAPTCFMIINNAVFEKTGVMDEKYFVYYDDTDFIYRTYIAGYKIKLLPQLHVYHKVSSLTGGKETLFSIFYGTRNRIYFIRKNLTGLKYFSSIFYTLLSRLLRYVEFNSQQKTQLIKGLREGFKI